MARSSKRYLPPPLAPGTRIKKLGEPPLPRYEECTPEQQRLVDYMCRFWLKYVFDSPQFAEWVKNQEQLQEIGQVTKK